MALTKSQGLVAAAHTKLFLAAVAIRSASTSSSAASSSFSRGNSNKNKPAFKKSSNNAGGGGGGGSGGGKPNIARELSPDVRKFFTGEGLLRTTPTNARFFRENPTIDHDHGKMVRLSLTPAVRDLAKEYGVQLAFSPRHIIHPHHLKYFDPRGHALTPKLRADYAKKVKEEPLWAFGTSFGDSAVVRTLPRRLLIGAVFRRLEEMGCKSGRGGDGRDIQGTLWIKVVKPQVVMRLSLDKFGEVVAEALHTHFARGPGEAGPPEEKQAATEQNNSTLQRRKTNDVADKSGSRDSTDARGSPRAGDVWTTLRRSRRD